MCHHLPPLPCVPLDMLHSPYGLKPDASWPRPSRLVLSLYSKVGPERRLVDLRPMPGTVLWLGSVPSSGRSSAPAARSWPSTARAAASRRAEGSCLVATRQGLAGSPRIPPLTRPRRGGVAARLAGDVSVAGGALVAGSTGGHDLPWHATRRQLP